jgi:hypothetical protein
MGWLVGLAATIMLSFGAVLAYQMACIHHACPIATAAEQEYDKIISGAHSYLAKGNDPQVLLTAIKEKLPEFPGLPNLAKYNLTPMQCGLVKLANLPEGVFVEYQTSTGSEPLTLMMVKTPESSNSPEVEGKSGKYHLSIRPEHSICSWHCKKSGLLYVMVARRQQNDPLAIAEVASIN